MSRKRPALLTFSLSVLLVGAGGLLVPAAAAAANLTAVAKGTSGTPVTSAAQFTVTGNSPVGIGVSTVSGGGAELTAGPGGSLPTAVQFPAYVASGAYPRAVVRVTPSSGTALDPGTADFSYGAVVRLDATSAGRSDDNGDNAFQRGLWNESSMFKLEFDDARPACTVHGSTGRVVLRAATRITRGKWYRVTCSRTGGTVSVAVTPVGAGYASATPARTSASGATGNVAFSGTRPASVGGKLTTSGAIDTAASDQFNGAVAEVWVSRP
jgi:hypothetical protein